MSDAITRLDQLQLVAERRGMTLSTRVSLGAWEDHESGVTVVVDGESMSVGEAADRFLGGRSAALGRSLEEFGEFLRTV